MCIELFYVKRFATTESERRLLFIFSLNGGSCAFKKKTIGKEWKERGIFPLPLFVHIALLWASPSSLHMIQYPVPHNEEPGDDHVGEQSGTQKGTGNDEFVVHAHHPPD